MIQDISPDQVLNQSISAKEQSASAVLLASCHLQKGVAAAITQFVHQSESEIIDYDQYVDVSTNRFYCRMQWSANNEPTLKENTISKFSNTVASHFDLNWNIRFVQQPMKIAVFISKEMAHLYALITHCLSKQWNAEISLIISNHDVLETEAHRFDIPFYHLPIASSNKALQEDAQLKLLKNFDIELVILARYMQIVSEKIIHPFRNRIINIHHSMLPAFAGAKPYHQAYQRGVKLIGATSHYVTEELDAGPIISQDTTSIEHRKTVQQMVNMGRELETSVLSRAVGLHVDSRILVSAGRTIIFD